MFNFIMKNTKKKKLNIIKIIKNFTYFKLSSICTEEVISEKDLK